MPTAAERKILEYLIETGFIDDCLVALANQVLAGCALPHEEQAAFRQGISEIVRWRSRISLSRSSWATRCARAAGARTAMLLL